MAELHRRMSRVTRTIRCPRLICKECACELLRHAIDSVVMLRTSCAFSSPVDANAMRIPTTWPMVRFRNSRLIDQCEKRGLQMAGSVQCPNPSCGRTSHLGEDPLGRIFRCPRCLTKLPTNAEDKHCGFGMDASARPVTQKVCILHPWQLDRHPWNHGLGLRSELVELQSIAGTADCRPLNWLPSHLSKV